MGEIISIANQKGGVGKTTTAINLSYALACLNQEVLVIDMDPQSNTTSGLGVSPEGVKASIYDVISGNAKAEEAIVPTAMEWLDVLPASRDLAGAEVELVSVPGREGILKAALAPVRKMYRYIFIDCPPSLGLLTLNALTASDSVLIPVQCEYYAMEGLAHFMDTVSKIQTFINPALRVDGGVMTMFDARINLSNQVKSEVSKFFGNRIYQTPVPRNVRIAEAPSFGQPIFTYDPACRGAVAYFDLGKEFLARRGADPAVYADAKPFVADEMLDYDLGD
ncbi:MAG: AAA family ATPase [Elusimicrobiaceae bacterium]|nr:AAA family ATPase [Elusimicrobiaceae bacterium]